MTKKQLRTFHIVLTVWLVIFLVLLIRAARAEGGVVIIGDGELIDAVAFSNGDTLTVLKRGDTLEFVYMYLGGGSVREQYAVGITAFARMKLIVSGRWAHLVASKIGVIRQFSFKLPEDTPHFNCPTVLVPQVVR